MENPKKPQTLVVEVAAQVAMEETAGMVATEAMMTNLQLLGFVEFAAKAKMATALSAELFDRANDRAAQDILYFLLSTYSKTKT